MGLAPLHLGRMRTTLLILLCAAGMHTAPLAARAAETAPQKVARTTSSLRIATYNIQFLSTEVKRQGARLEKLRRVIHSMKPDIVALQEVDNRAAAQLVFPSEEWQIVIDDESSDRQDLAFAVRRPLQILNLPPDLDADDEHFLFSGWAYENAFPSRRDALIVMVADPVTSKVLDVINVHQKSRLGGRHTTDPRREEAAQLLVAKLKSRGGRNYVVLGDFNDNPDDRSLNILETGDPETTGGPEENEGPFLTNLLEPLVGQDLVTHGANILKQTPEGLLDIRVPGSRSRNNRYRGRGVHTGPILFDQILISSTVKDAVVSGSVSIFREAFALEGAGRTRPSDHLPVYVDISTAELPHVN